MSLKASTYLRNLQEPTPASTLLVRHLGRLPGLQNMLVVHTARILSRNSKNGCPFSKAISQLLFSYLSPSSSRSQHVIISHEVGMGEYLKYSRRAEDSGREVEEVTILATQSAAPSSCPVAEVAVIYVWQLPQFIQCTN